jgi:hypothetical protein
MGKRGGGLAVRATQNLIVIAREAKQSGAGLRALWIAASPSALRNDEVLYLATGVSIGGCPFWLTE